MAGKKENQKKEPKKFNIINKTTIILGMITLIILTYLAILTSGLGVIGDFAGLQSFRLFGIGAFVLPPILVVNLILVLVKKLNREMVIKLIYIYAIFLMFLMLVDITVLSAEPFDRRVALTMDLALVRRGAGLVGTGIGYVLVRFIGKLGSYIVAFIVSFFGILSFMNMPVVEFFKELLELIKKAHAITAVWIQGFLEERKRKSVEKVSEDNTSLPKQNDEESLENPFVDYIPDISNHKDFYDTDETIEEDTQLSVEDFDIDIQTSPKVHYIPPPLQLLRSSVSGGDAEYKQDISEKADAIMGVLNSFRVKAKMSKVTRGPSVTCFELLPDPGVRVATILGLNDDLALALASRDIRIQAPIPGKSAVGIEVPNRIKDDVFLKDIISTQEYNACDSMMPLSLGKDLTGRPVISKIESMPHLLIAGATGSGKSVCINTIILSILYKSGPEEVKFILIDPKMVELSAYNGIPHLVVPVVTDPRKASAALNWAVREMDRRYNLFAENMVKDIHSYRHKMKTEDLESLPNIVIIIDELADLMMVAAQEVEDYICRLAQLARACGIHLIVATQRPSVDVITGTIKANIPSRISFAVSSQIDSRTILDVGGAEKLLGRGDMLFSQSNFRHLLRLQGAFVSEKEVMDVVSYIKDTNVAEYNQKAIDEIEEKQKTKSLAEDYDELLLEAVDTVLLEGQATVSLLQRKLKVGYARAGRLVDTMQDLGIIGPSEGSKPRRLLVSRNILRAEVEDEYSQ